MDRLFKLYKGRLGAFTDLCGYWLFKARAKIKSGRAKRAGLLATQGIRGGVNREVLDQIKKDGGVFFAESDRDWILDGASVHVSMIGFDDGTEKSRTLDGKIVAEINSNLTSAADVTSARPLKGIRANWCYGSQQKANFDIPVDVAIAMLRSPNAASVPNSDVVRPSLNGKQILQRTHESFAIDFGMEQDIATAARYEAPFEYVRSKIYASRQNHREPIQRRCWWLHARPSPLYRKYIAKHDRFIVTPVSSKHRMFVWGERAVLVDHATVVFPTDEESVFGILHSKPHEVWARSLATQVRERESGLRYTPKSCFETFPFPEPTDAQRAAIAAAAKELDQLRTNWLNPPEWTKTETLTFPGSADGPWARYVKDGTVHYPRLVPRDVDCAIELKKRTLTNLYNARPAWLELAHKRLDEAVFAAYGWSSGMSDKELLAKLLELNLARAASGK